MSDLIKREDAREAIEKLMDIHFDRQVVLAKARDAIGSLPSVEPKTGKWVDIDNYYRMATCSRCHKVTMFEKWGEYTKPYHFCPNCGAKMEGGDSE